MPEQTLPAGGHERRDIDVRVVTWFAIGLVLAAVGIFLAVVGLYKLFEAQHPSPDAPSRIAWNPRLLAPEPRLQIYPTADWEKYQGEEKKKLNSYGWVDRRNGVIRIPIERAMELVVQRGLPTRGPGTQDSSGITPEQLQQQKATATAPKP